MFLTRYLGYPNTAFVIRTPSFILYPYIYIKALQFGKTFIAIYPIPARRVNKRTSLSGDDEDNFILPGVCRNQG
ncbi:hypothetical protein XELAEV_18039820mg [Xenopus laevis]|uniref:Uncharacterized protein n=1 Tax=Xenopus laevis TaxID=8355 RepID=A0A974C8H4_XENLA|nr:hypothetical protein XELAEV_18039820mg [Xenopus laevis]